MGERVSLALRLGLALVAAPLIIVADQVTKWMVLNEPRFNALGCLDGSQPCGGFEISPIMDLSMVWNRGMSFGALQSEGIMRWVLFAITGLIALGFLVWLLRAERRLTAISLAMVVGGALGNMIDRARFGAVVDFLNFSDIYFVWVFNIADAAITVGAALLFLDQFLLSRNSKQPGDELPSGVDKSR